MIDGAEPQVQEAWRTRTTCANYPRCRNEILAGETGYWVPALCSSRQLVCAKCARADNEYPLFAGRGGNEQTNERSE